LKEDTEILASFGCDQGWRSGFAHARTTAGVLRWLRGWGALAGVGLAGGVGMIWLRADRGFANLGRGLVFLVVIS
jgi:hypothetical protein